ncbi:DUF6355 family natural product biosynthesis protein [Streptomyces sp. MMBL 11-3]|uniref:DUF6355 family natural product biosynthesis protein n=1 Tax=Streptomyces sp. MMBL 11-3 TaxID=3382639 RepID=UPI0039B5F803
MGKKLSTPLRIAAAVLGAAALTSTAFTTTAQAASAGGASARACGYYETSDTAYYGHCGSRNAIIEIDLDWTTTERYQCVPPGETNLGSTDDIDYAHYIGDC